MPADSDEGRQIDWASMPGRLGRTARTLLAAVALAAVLAVGVLDTVTGPVLDLTVLYLVPIGIATVLLGVRMGLATVLLAFFVEVIPPLVLHAAPPFLVVADGLTHLFIRALGVLLVHRLMEQLRAFQALSRRHESDLDIARQVHSSFFADGLEPQRGFEIGRRLRFLREIGGDYYHFAEFDGGMFFCIADISGKGVSAALFTAALNQALATTLPELSSLADVVRVVNQRLAETLPSDRFITLLACVFRDEQVSYTIEGHERPLLLYRDGSLQVLDSATSPPLGVMGDADVTIDTVPFGPGDMLLAVTDGVTESSPFYRASDLLSRTFIDQSAYGPQAVCDRIVGMLDDEGARDDVAVICIRRTSPPVSA